MSIVRAAVAGWIGGVPPIRWYRPVCLGLTLAVLAFVAIELAAMETWIRYNAFASGDLPGYLTGARQWLLTGSPYDPATVVGPWTLGWHSFIHPPSALLLFVPFLWLPWALWWLVPLAVTTVALWRLRPTPWTWPLMALCLAWPRSLGSLLAGNTDMWAMAFVAAGAVWGWPVVLLAVKPTFAPLALVAVRRRSAWVAGVAVVLLNVPLLPLWLDWWAVTRNADLGLGYSVFSLPLVCVGLVAWAGRR